MTAAGGRAETCCSRRFLHADHFPGNRPDGTAAVLAPAGRSRQGSRAAVTVLLKAGGSAAAGDGGQAAAEVMDWITNLFQMACAVQSSGSGFPLLSPSCYVFVMSCLVMSCRGVTWHNGNVTFQLQSAQWLEILRFCSRVKKHTRRETCRVCEKFLCFSFRGTRAAC